VNPEGVELQGKASKTYHQLSICDLQEGVEASVKGCIVQLTKRNPVYDTCPACKKGLDKEKRCPNGHNFREPNHSMVFNCVLDDGSGTISCVFFGKNAESLIAYPAKMVIDKVNELGVEGFVKLKEDDLLGMELLVSGKVVHNTFSDRTELIANNFQQINPIIEAKKMLGKT